MTPRCPRCRFVSPPGTQVERRPNGNAICGNCLAVTPWAQWQPAPVKPPTPVDGVFEALMPEHAGVLRAVCTVIHGLPPGVLENAVEQLAMTETAGPMVDPTAWLSGARARRARQTRDLLHTMAVLQNQIRDALQEESDEALRDRIRRQGPPGQ